MDWIWLQAQAAAVVAAVAAEAEAAAVAAAAADREVPAAVVEQAALLKVFLAKARIGLPAAAVADVQRAAVAPLLGVRDGRLRPQAVMPERQVGLAAKAEPARLAAVAESVVKARTAAEPLYSLHGVCLILRIIVLLMLLPVHVPMAEAAVVQALLLPVLLKERPVLPVPPVVPVPDWVHWASFPVMAAMALPAVKAVMAVPVVLAVSVVPVPVVDTLCPE